MSASTVVARNRTAVLELLDNQIADSKLSLERLESTFLEGDRDKLSLHGFNRRSMEHLVLIDFFQRMQGVLQSFKTLSMLIPNVMIVQDFYTESSTIQAKIHSLTTQIIIKLVADI